jgi:clan AA aspartic protease (TIGR02281 family)
MMIKGLAWWLLFSSGVWVGHLHIDHYFEPANSLTQSFFSQVMKTGLPQAEKLLGHASVVPIKAPLVASGFSNSNKEGSQAGVQYQSISLTQDKGRLYLAAPIKANKTEMSIVPLKKISPALMVDALLNKQVDGTFILDTGATYTSISREIAQELGLDLVHSPKISITTANGRIEVPKVVIKDLDVNGLVAHNVEATVIDVRHGSSFNGLLGLSFIKKFKLTIDPEAGQLIFQTN